jgi:hypothetical protein
VIQGGDPNEARAPAIQRQRYAVNQEAQAQLVQQMGGANPSSCALPAPNGAALSGGIAGDVGAAADVYNVLATLQQAAQKMKNAANLQWYADTQMQVNAELDDADKLSQAAKSNRDAAFTDAASKMGQGAVGIVGAGVSVGASLKANVAGVQEQDNLENARTGTKLSPEQVKAIQKHKLVLDLDKVEIQTPEVQRRIKDKESEIEAIRKDTPERTAHWQRHAAQSRQKADTWRTHANTAGTLSNGLSSVLNGGSGITSADATFSANQANADAKRADALSTAWSSAAQNSQQYAASMDTVRQAALDARKAVNEATTSGSQSEISNIAA